MAYIIASPFIYILSYNYVNNYYRRFFLYRKTRQSEDFTRVKLIVQKSDR